MESGLFEGEEAVLHLIDRIVGPLGLRVDESSPYVDARLPDGSRFHAITRPFRSVALWSPCARSR
jgi:pilus assembly protein CpaF